MDSRNNLCPSNKTNVNNGGQKDDIFYLMNLSDHIQNPQSTPMVATISRQSNPASDMINLCQHDFSSKSLLLAAASDPINLYQHDSSSSSRLVSAASNQINLCQHFSSSLAQMVEVASDQRNVCQLDSLSSALMVEAASNQSNLCQQDASSSALIVEASSDQSNLCWQNSSLLAVMVKVASDQSNLCQQGSSSLAPTITVDLDLSNPCEQVSSSSALKTATERHLPDDLVELTLDRLPLFDYVSFGAVCRQWHLIQRGHYRRYKSCSLTPPMLRLPWVFIYKKHQRNKGVQCYSPFEKCFYRLPCLINPPTGYKSFCLLTSSNGWLLLVTKLVGHVLPAVQGTIRLLLLNPVTRAEFHLHPLMTRSAISLAAMLSSPAEKNCAILLRNRNHEFFMNRLGESHWTKVVVPNGVCFVVSCAGKFYCTGSKDRITIIDPFPNFASPYVENFDMDCSQMEYTWTFRHTLAALDKEVLYLQFPKCPEVYDIREVRVFKADLSRRMWVRMESLGDRMLLVDKKSCHSLVAADIGGKRNCIYFSGDFVNIPRETPARESPEGWSPWKVFDLEAAELMDGELQLPNPRSELDPLQAALCWILPSLDKVDPAYSQASQKLLH